MGAWKETPIEIVRFIEESIRMKERLKKDGIDLDAMVWERERNE